jgi:hypothetical protein
MIARIAFVGKMGSGKTTLAKYISLEYGFTAISFASKIKELAVTLFGMDLEKKDRTLLQAIGQKMREIDPAVWPKCLMKQVKEYYPPAVRFVIDDCRFLNEAELLVDSGFTLIGIVRDETERINFLKSHYGDITEAQLKHSTESEIDPVIYGSGFCQTVYENMSIPEMQRRLSFLLTDCPY